MFTIRILGACVEYRVRPKRQYHIFFTINDSSITSSTRTRSIPSLDTMSGDTIFQKVKKSKNVQSKEKAVHAEDVTTTELPIEDISESL